MALKKQTVTIDCTPTWEGILPWLIAMIEENGHSAQATTIAKEQLKKMAQVADKYVESIGKEK
jgi:hypothetical protein